MYNIYNVYIYNAYIYIHPVFKIYYNIYIYIHELLKVRVTPRAYTEGHGLFRVATLVLAKRLFQDDPSDQNSTRTGSPVMNRTISY